MSELGKAFVIRWLVTFGLHLSFMTSSALASLDVLAYVLGDVLDPAAAVYDERLWYISSGEGMLVRSDKDLAVAAP